MRATDLAFIENHLAFMARHRGNVMRERNGFQLDGDTPGFNSWIPLDDHSDLPADCAAVRCVESRESAWPDRLVSTGFQPQDRLAYMELIDRSNTQLSNDVREVVTSSEADAFAEVQLAAFIPSGDSARPWWAQRFHEAAQQNYTDSQQRFFFIEQEARAVSVLLKVDTPEVTGFYAVATKPDWQARGLSSVLLSHAIASTPADRRIVLQANYGGYAHSFYAKRRFVTRLVMTVWRRARES